MPAPCGKTDCSPLDFFYRFNKKVRGHVGFARKEKTIELATGADVVLTLRSIKCVVAIAEFDALLEARGALVRRLANTKQ